VTVSECNGDFSTVKRGLADLLAFIAVNNEADDMTLVVDVGVRNRREIQVATLYIGALVSKIGTHIEPHNTQNSRRVGEDME
jgi:hypothetical protein